MALSQGDILAGKYRIEKLLGEGGMGAVYLATNQVLQKRVALKVMNSRFAAMPAAVERFLREAVAASRVSHPSIVQVFDAGEHEKAPWIAMEFLLGESLGERLEKGPLPLDEVLKMAAGVLSALAEVHEEGIIHRDLKPDNIFLAQGRGGDWIPKVLDFGVAKDTSENQLNKLTATGAVVGTAYYLSPEQAKGLADIDARTDVYAMGVVLFECLSGEMPYQAETITQLIAKMFSEQPRMLHEVAPQIPRSIADVVSTCIDLDRGKRFQTARALLGALTAASEATAKTPKDLKAMGLAKTAYDMAPVSSQAGLSQAPRLPSHLMPSDPGLVAPAPSHPGVGQSYVSHDGVSQTGMSQAGQGYAPLPVSHLQTPMPAHRQGGVHATTFRPGEPNVDGSLSGFAPSKREESGGSRAGLIALVVLLFLLGAGGTGLGVWLFLGKDGADPSAVATANQVAQNPTEEPAENAEPTQNAEPAQNAEPVQNAEPAQVPVENAEPVANAEPAQNAEAPTAEEPVVAEAPGRGRGRGRRGERGQEAQPAGAEPVIAPPPPIQPPPPQGLPPQRTGLSQAQLLGAIQSQASALNQECYQRRLARVPGLGGVITIAWNVRADGRVEAARVVHNGTNDEWLARCTLQLVQRTRFPAAANGQNTPGRYPFFFRPPQ